MNQCLVACRSLTYAQRSAHALERAGFSAHVIRMPAGLVKGGCGYAVKIYETNLTEVVAFLREKNFTIKKAFRIGPEGQYTEVSI